MTENRHYFFAVSASEGLFELDETESRHCLKVMRKRLGDTIYLLDGAGAEIEARIEKAGRTVLLSELSRTIFPRESNLTIAVSPTKNADRMEWMVEKLVEIGIRRILFIETEHGEQSRIKASRLEMKAQQALKQSGNHYLPEIELHVPFKTVLDRFENGYLAHCHPGEKLILAQSLPKSTPVDDLETLIAIGPEGDFSQTEVTLAADKGYKMVSLGKSRLRTETAAVAACTVYNLFE